MASAPDDNTISAGDQSAVNQSAQLGLANRPKEGNGASHSNDEAHSHPNAASDSESPHETSPGADSSSHTSSASHTASEAFEETSDVSSAGHEPTSHSTVTSSQSLSALETFSSTSSQSGSGFGDNAAAGAGQAVGGVAAGHHGVPGSVEYVTKTVVITTTAPQGFGTGYRTGNMTGYGTGHGSGYASSTNISSYSVHSMTSSTHVSSESPDTSDDSVDDGIAGANRAKSGDTANESHSSVDDDSNDEDATASAGATEKSSSFHAHSTSSASAPSSAPASTSGTGHGNGTAATNATDTDAASGSSCPRVMDLDDDQGSNGPTDWPAFAATGGTAAGSSGGWSLPYPTSGQKYPKSSSTASVSTSKQSASRRELPAHALSEVTPAALSMSHSWTTHVLKRQESISSASSHTEGLASSCTKLVTELPDGQIQVSAHCPTSAPEK